MPGGKFSLLPDRGVVSVTGGDAGRLLQGLITNDMDALEDGGDAIHAGLLTPQGKILFEFFVVKYADGFYLDVARTRAGDLAKRLGMYKLRADVTLQDASDQFQVLASTELDTLPSGGPADAIAYQDPRHPKLGARILTDANSAIGQSDVTDTQVDYDALRISLGIPEGGKDYDYGDAYPHEADFDLLNGVSFTKGCYVGQEVIARMQNKTVVRKRVVKISGEAPLSPGAAIMLGETAIGRVGSVNGCDALAMVRIDRAIDARDQGVALIANGVVVTPDEGPLARYAMSVATRQAAPGIG